MQTETERQGQSETQNEDEYPLHKLSRVSCPLCREVNLGTNRQRPRLKSYWKAGSVKGNRQNDAIQEKKFTNDMICTLQD